MWQAVTDRTKVWLVGLITTLLVVLVALYPGLVIEVSSETAAQHQGTIPPAFSGNRIAYGWSVFSLFIISSLSIRKMISIFVSYRSCPAADSEDIACYRVAVFFFCAMAALGTAPEVILLLLWGEVSEPVQDFWLIADRVGDGLAGFSFLGALTMLVRAEHFVRVKVGERSGQVRASTAFRVVPRPDRMREHVRLIAGVAFIALGLALWK